MGTARAWLPSRRSTLHQIGARVRTRLGHCRSARLTGGNGRYLRDGSLSMALSFFLLLILILILLSPCQAGQQEQERPRLKSKNPTAGWQWGPGNPVIRLEPNCRATQQQLKVQTTIHRDNW